MRKYLLLPAVFAALFSLSLVQSPAGITIGVDEAEARRDDKVDICHIPPGNPSNMRTISVDESAVDAHLAHGDYMGECGSVSSNDNESNSNRSRDNDNESNSNRSRDNDNESNSNRSRDNDNESNSNRSRDNDNESNSNRSRDNDNESNSNRSRDNDNESNSNRSNDNDNESNSNSSNENEGNENEDEDKVTVCHISGTSVSEIEVNESALSAHLGHGDVEGSCPTGPVCMCSSSGSPSSGTCVCPSGNPGIFIDGGVTTPEAVRSIQGQ